MTTANVSEMHSVRSRLRRKYSYEVRIRPVEDVWLVTYPSVGRRDEVGQVRNHGGGVRMWTPVCLARDCVRRHRRRRILQHPTPSIPARPAAFRASLAVICAITSPHLRRSSTASLSVCDPELVGGASLSRHVRSRPTDPPDDAPHCRRAAAL